MAGFKSAFIDNLWKSEGLAPVELPGTSPPQYSRTPSVFIPALIAAILPSAVLTALVTAWNTLATKLSLAAPATPTVAGVTAGIVAQTANVDVAQPLVTTALSAFNESPPVNLIGNAGELALRVNGLQTTTSGAFVGGPFEPVAPTNLQELQVTIAPIVNQANTVIGDYTALQSLLVSGFATATTLTQVSAQTALASAAMTTDITRISALAGTVFGSGPSATVNDAAAECIDANVTAAAILAWLNSVAGTAPAIVATGAPWSNLQAWRAAQGI